MESLSVAARSGAGELVLDIDYEVGATTAISASGAVGRRFTAEGADLFNALLNLRRELEASDIFLCCNGARADVWPSGMSGQMGDGRSAYRHVSGRRPASSDLVDILAPAPCSEVVTVDEQAREHKARHVPQPRPRREMPRATPEEARHQPGKVVYDFDDIYGPDDLVDFRLVRGLVPVDKDGEMKDEYWPNDAYEGP